MNRGWLAALALVLATTGGAVLVGQHDGEVSQHKDLAVKPRLALLSSLPLLFGEQFGLESPRPPAMARIEHKYRVVPIAVADSASLKGFSRLLMAHPRAQLAEVLVELDAWVRGGGHVVLLADPRFAWEGSRALGDPLRPPPDFADTGLLAHWGLRLGVDETGEGELRPTSRNCIVKEAGLLARCRVGRGTARIIADADFLMANEHQGKQRLNLLLTELDAE